MKVLFSRYSSLVVAAFVLGLSTSPYLYAQTQIVRPVDEFIHTTSTDPLRYFDPTDIGFVAGDLNGDGEKDYIVQNQFYPDLSTPGSGDYLESSYVYNMNANGGRDNVSVHIGAILFPAGDLNNDGRDDLISYSNNEFRIYSFPTGMLDFSTLPAPFKTIQIPDNTFDSEFRRLVAFHDLDGDGVDDIVFSTLNYSAVSQAIHIIFGDDSSENINLVSTDVTSRYSTRSIALNAGDVAGDTTPEIVVLSNSTEDSEVLATTFEIDSDTLAAIDTTGLNVFVNINSDERFYIADIDGQNKDDIMFANNRYQGIGGFTRIFFNPPYSYIAFNAVQDNPSKVNSLLDGEAFHDARAIRNGMSIDRVNEVSPGRTQIALFAFGAFAICEGQDMDPNAGVGAEVCGNPIVLESSEDNQIRPTKYSPEISRTDIDGDGNNDIRVGFLDLNEFLIGGGFIKIVIDALEVRRELKAISEFINERIGPMQLLTQGDMEFFFFYSNLPRRTLVEFFRVENTLRMRRQIIAYLLGPESVFNLFGLNGLVVTQSEKEVHVFDIVNSLTLVKSAAAAEDDTLRADQIIDLTAFQEIMPGFGTLYSDNIGDIDNDGLDDMLISTGFVQDSSQKRINKAWIFKGATETLSETPDYTFEFSQDTTIDEISFFSISEISGVGDVNDDGIDDYMMDNWLYFGSEELPTSYKYPDIILEADSVNGEPLSLENYAAGDFNGDGVNDIVAGVSGFGELPFAKIYYGGAEMDGNSDHTLYATRSSLGREGTDFVSSAGFGNIDFQFMPREAGKTYQDLLYLAGPFGYTNDAIIFHGGTESDSLPDVRLEVTPEGGTGFSSSTPTVVGDFNKDGFYDVVLTESGNGDDALTSSRSYLFSPNSGIEVSNEVAQIDNPMEYRLSQNYPNPFNPSTNIEFKLGTASPVSIRIYDILGREVATVIYKQQYSSGSHTVRFDASALASGIYLYKLEAGAFTQTRKMTLIK